MEDIHRFPSGATATVCVPAAFSGHLYSFSNPVAGFTETNLVGTSLAFMAIHTRPSRPTIGVGGTDLGVGTGYSSNGVLGTLKRPRWLHGYAYSGTQERS